MRFAPGQTIGPRNLPTLPPPCIPPPIRVTAAAPVRFVNAPTEATAPLRFSLGVDFDGVLCRPAWPKIGAEMPGAMDFLRWLAGRDIGRVLWTCRTKTALDDALAWLAERGFPPSWWDAINDTPEPIVRRYGGDARKLGVDAFLDDRAIGFPATAGDASVPDWPRIQAELLTRLADWREANP